MISALLNLRLWSVGYCLLFRGFPNKRPMNMSNVTTNINQPMVVWEANMDSQVRVHIGVVPNAMLDRHK